MFFFVVFVLSAKNISIYVHDQYKTQNQNTLVYVQQLSVEQHITVVIID